MSFSASSEFTTVLSLLGRPVGSSSLMVRSTVFEVFAQFSDMLHSHYSVTLRRYQLVVNFDGKTFLGLKSRITLRTSSWDQVSRVVIAHQLILLEAFDWVLHHLLLAAPTISVTSYRKIKCLLTRNLQAKEPRLVNLPRTYPVGNAACVEICTLRKLCSCS